jgi:hypothetical protein
MTTLRPVTLCEAKNRAGNPCRRPAGWGTDHAGFGHCKLHGGSNPSGKKYAAKLERTWRDSLAEDIDPSLKVIRQLRDGEDVNPRERLRAAQWLVEKAVELTEGTGGEIEVHIRFPSI